MSILSLLFAYSALAYEVKLTPCPPFGSCVQRLLAIDGEIVPWPELERMAEQIAPAPMDLVEIRLEIVSGLVELRVDGRTLALADADIVGSNLFVWQLPVLYKRDLQIEVVSLSEGASYYTVRVEAATSSP